MVKFDLRFFFGGACVGIFISIIVLPTTNIAHTSDSILLGIFISSATAIIGVMLPRGKAEKFLKMLLDIFSR